eukprot:CAMPEP_0181220048 /NCGR_PEP_ID=MMETSP1096-20121128/28624_1 /TAXON_ID=156174 ORGANISM="Chrysochromulina ericina, Strain CCMP281" /NCGR_SAMPLE_ID=MMETSP1096 /ASSEMBLY_ACC=CAM_ASM_000453 /LENGTH=87 /DNA_ID=CAMNT_0023312515 /DNA_START=80 /DNA_END=343 /DNA_ORIENTATION=+
MGRIPTKGFKLHDVRIPAKKPKGSGTNCGVQMAMFLACIEKNSMDDRACKAAKEALDLCMASATPLKSKHKPTINYHLQKFIQAFKR